MDQPEQQLNMLMAPDGARLVARINKEGMGTVELNGTDISKIVKTLAITADAGEPVLAVLSVYVSELDVTFDGATVVTVPADDLDAEHIATRTANILEERSKQHIQAIRDRLNQ